MSTFLFALYILVWPAASAAVLALIVYAVLRDYRAAKREGRELV